MATKKAGPLVSEIRGRVGGMVFQGCGAGGMVRSSRKPVSGQTGYQRDVRRIMAQASTGWGKLTAGMREDWAVRAGGERKAFVQYVKAWLVQVGATTIDAPGVPVQLGRPMWMMTQTLVDPEGLWLAGFTRDLQASEEAIVRVYRQVPRTWNKFIRRTVWYENVGFGEGLGAQLDLVQNLMSFPSGSATRNGVSTMATTWTLEMWIRPDVVQGSVVQTLYSTFFFSKTVYWNVSGTLRWREDGLQQVIGPTPGYGTWFYVVILADGVGGTIDCYINGAPYGAQVNYTARPLDGLQSIGQQVGHVNRWLEGRYGPVRISDVLRTPAEIAATWAGGEGRPWVTDGNTEVLLQMRETTGVVLEDTSGNGRDWVRTNLWNAMGPFCRMIYPEASKVMPAGRVGLETVVKDTSRLPGQGWQERVDF